MRYRFILTSAAVAASVVLTAGCARPIAPGRAPTTTVLVAPETDPIEVPSRWCGAYVIVDVMVNGLGPFAMLLDTGSDAAVFDDDLAPRFTEAVFADDVEVTDAEGAALRAGARLRVESMLVGDSSVGTMEIGGFDGLFLDLGAISGALGTPIDGVLGFRVFYDVLLTVDYPGERVLVANGTLSDDGFDHVVPMRGDRSPAVELTLAGESVYALIDTAGTSSLTLEDWSMLPLETPPVPVGTSVTVGGVQSLERGRLAADALCAEHVFQRPLFSPTTGGAKFGTDMLRHFSITFDQRARLVRLDRGGARTDAIVFPAHRGLGVGFNRGSDAWDVIEVFGGGGTLRVGDRVVMLDGIPVGEFACSGFRSLMDAAEYCRATVERDGRRVEVDVPVRVLVP